MPSFEVQLASPSDAKELLAIYEPYVVSTAITFEYDVPSLTDFESRITKIQNRYPYLKALYDGQIVGYAYASTFKDRAAYDWSVEISIYIKADCHHLGIGKCLYSKLEEYLKLQNIRNVCACIAYPNPSSVAFHEYFGFTKTAHFHKSGYKFNTWHDMIWMEKFIHPHNEIPEAFIPFPMYQKEFLQER